MTKFTLMILVNGVRCARWTGLKFTEVGENSELTGPDLWDFNLALKLTGKAMEVRGDASSVTVIVAHEEM